tara:strand:+ start:610 stop:723 length:114 start_codon:yes stop_codon:yes gene_type:complete
MKYLIIFIIVSACSVKDYDFNPSTTIVNQLIKLSKND